MPRPCAVCLHPLRGYIDAELARGTAYSAILQQAQKKAPLSRSALSRHALSHVGLHARKATNTVPKQVAPPAGNRARTAPPAPQYPSAPPPANPPAKPPTIPQLRKQIAKLRTKADVLAHVQRVAGEMHHCAVELQQIGNHPAASRAFRDELAAVDMLVRLQGFDQQRTAVNLPHLQGLPPTQQLSELVAATLAGRLSIEDATQVGKLVSQSAQAADAAALQRWLAAVRGGEHPLEVAYRLTQDPRLLLAARRQGLTITAEVLPDASDAD